MPKLVLRLLTLGIVCAGGVFGQQGSFGQIAYGGSWQTTFTLINVSSSGTATVTLSFYADSGSPLNAPVQGFGVTSAYTFAIPAGGSQNVVLQSSDSNTTQGWASMSASGGTVRGQGSFRFLVPNGTGAISEAVVPLSFPPGSTACLIPLPSGNPIALVPFDNSNGYVTSLAFANPSASSSESYVIEFDDQSGAPLAADTVTLGPRQHRAFVSRDAYPALLGQKGVVRIHGSVDLSLAIVLGLLSNSSGAVTTIIPVIQ
jgi:hypothetical protein